MCVCVDELSSIVCVCVQIQCHGVLTKKQDLLDSGKRANDRNWRSYYAVLASNQISFYRDRREARLVMLIMLAAIQTRHLNNY